MQVQKYRSPYLFVHETFFKQQIQVQRNVHLLSGVTLSFLGHPDRLRREHEKYLSPGFKEQLIISNVNQ